MEELQNMRTRKEQYRVSKDPALQKTMSVPEMRKLLGLKKTESYWLVHRNFFKTEIIGGVMRIDIESFEKWYANQVKHKKVNGEAPGRELTKTSYSFQEAANLLGVNNANLYEIILIFPTSKKNNKTVRVLKTPKTDSSTRKVYIPKSVAQCLVELKAEQDEIKEALGTETEWRRYQGRPGRFRTCSGRHGNRSIWPHYR